MGVRVSAGKVLLWRAALQELRDIRWELVRLLPIAVGFLVFAHLPWIPVYERGLLTGAWLVGLAWVVSWVVWVVSGLGFRLNGVWAEQVTNDVCRTHPNALAYLPSYKFSNFDVDTLLATRSAIYAVETKWRSKGQSRHEVVRQARQLHRDVTLLQRELSDQPIPREWIRGVLVVRGPGAKGLKCELLDLGGGARIRVVPGPELPQWLDGQATGMVGPDFATQLMKDLRDSNSFREREIDAGPVLRWIARVK